MGIVHPLFGENRTDGMGLKAFLTSFFFWDTTVPRGSQNQETTTGGIK